MKKRLLWIALAVCLASGGWVVKGLFDYYPQAIQTAQAEPTTAQDEDFRIVPEKLTLPAQRQEHLLASHKHGAGEACKSEFPATWDDAKIIDTAKSLAANDNAQWKTEQNGYVTSENTVEGLTIRVVVNPEKNEIVTAYPLNVTRNPCPARQKPANDNEKSEQLTLP